METAIKLSNLRRDLVNVYNISKEDQQRVIDITSEVRKLEKRLEKKVTCMSCEAKVDYDTGIFTCSECSY